MFDTTNIIDVPLLRKGLDYITSHPEDWYQGDWITRSFMLDGTEYRGEGSHDRWQTVEQTSKIDWCGTTGCLAGTVVVTILGARPLFSEDCVNTLYIEFDGEVKRIQDVARQALGLTTHQADRLFFGSNDLYDLWHMANEFTDGEIEVPLQFQ